METHRSQGVRTNTCFLFYQQSSIPLQTCQKLSPQKSKAQIQIQNRDLIQKQWQTYVCAWNQREKVDIYRIRCQEKNTDKEKLLVSYQKCNNQGKILIQVVWVFRTKQEKHPQSPAMQSGEPLLKTVFVHARHLSFWTGGSHRLELVGQCLFWETARAGKFSNSPTGHNKTRECSGALTPTEDNVTRVENSCICISSACSTEKDPNRGHCAQQIAALLYIQLWMQHYYQIHTALPV